MIGETTWQVNPRTGEAWKVSHDTEMSEAEVEGQVGEVGEVVGDQLSAARELLRAEVGCTCFFRVALSDVCI